jgi:hypothetical protein
MERRLAALLYHPWRPCANPGAGAMMNKQQAISLEQDHG